MRYRALVFEDDDDIRSLLWSALDQRGYEVFTFPHPGACPLYVSSTCECPLPASCCDFIISDIEMPVARGIDLVASQLKKGCKCAHIALISGSWVEADIRWAEQAGCKVFHKPFTLAALHDWLDQCERQIQPDRCLSTWPLGDQS
jgi:DNA-binding response OmpR family regulator